MLKLAGVSRIGDRGSGAEPTDAELVYRARGGDRRAEALLYSRHASAILGLATRLLADAVEARDVVQDTFLLAFRKLDQLEQVEAFDGWLKTIAVRNVHRRYRRRRMGSWFGLTSDEAERGLRAIAAPDTPPDVLAELALIEPALEALRPEHRVAWSLRHIEGESLADVARLLDCSLATAKRYISKAEQALAERVQETSR